MACALTGNDMGDPFAAPLPGQLDAGGGGVTADGAYDGVPVYDTVAALADDIPTIIPRNGTAASP